jgi:hypothetical protein
MSLTSGGQAQGLPPTKRWVALATCPFAVGTVGHDMSRPHHQQHLQPSSGIPAHAGTNLPAGIGATANGAGDKPPRYADRPFSGANVSDFLLQQLLHLGSAGLQPASVRVHSWARGKPSCLAPYLTWTPASAGVTSVCTSLRDFAPVAQVCNLRPPTAGAGDKPPRYGKANAAFQSASLIRHFLCVPNPSFS